MTKGSLLLALAVLVCLPLPALGADVTFAVKGPPGGKAAFHYVLVAGGLPKTKTVTKTTEIDGVDYYVWKTSIAKIAHVCGFHVTSTASSKCVGEMGKPLKVQGNFVVLK